MPDFENEELTQEQIDELREELLSLREELDRLLRESKDAVKAVSPDPSLGRLTRLDAIQQQKMAQEERRRRDIRRKQIGVALASIESGDYGFCKRCEEPIGYKRLKAKPESPFCMQCMSSIERR